MKTIRINVSKEVSTANKAWKAQRMHIMNVKSIIKTFVLTTMILLTVSISAQSFSEINGLGKNPTEVKKFVAPTFFYKGQAPEKFEGLRVVNYHSNQLGLVSYLFDSKDICVKMFIPTISQRNYVLTGFPTRALEHNITIIEQF